MSVRKAHWLSAAVLAVGIGGAVPSVASAGERYYDGPRERCEEYVQRPVCFGEMPHAVRTAARCENHGAPDSAIDNIYYIRRDGRAYFSFVVHRRYADVQVRVDTGGRVLSRQEVACAEPPPARYSRDYRDSREYRRYD